jgi:hypothetical protein
MNFYGGYSMFKALGKLFTGTFFVSLSNILPDDKNDVLKLFSLGGMWLASFLTIENEYKTPIEREKRSPWLKPFRVTTPALKTTLLTVFFFLEMFKDQTLEGENSDLFEGASYGGFAFVTLMETLSSLEMVNRRGETLDKLDAFLAFLSTVLLSTAAVGKIKILEKVKSLESAALIGAGAFTVLQSSIQSLKDFTYSREKSKESDPVEGLQGYYERFPS